MEDRELLELAAKAVGVCLHPDGMLRREYGNWGCDTTCTVCKKDPSDAPWEPLSKDGDALRLAVKLEIDLCFMNGDTHALDKTEGGPDKLVNTRRAIVRAAAAIGKAMP